jgi:Golgi SNAP receptor complex protein 2
LEQRDRLKAMQRKMFDVMSMLGVSNSTLRYMERRASVDKAIVYGGMVLTLVFLWGMWSLTHPGKKAALGAG